MSNSSTQELRFTETNSADDSAGKTWGLEGDLFWFIVGGGFASVVLLLLLFSVSRWTLLSALVPSLVPIGLALLYVLAFRQGKPPGYDIEAQPFGQRRLDCQHLSMPNRRITLVMPNT